MGKKLKKGNAGNAAQYMTRTQAVRKLQLRLSEFRRLCILKGIHPREPKKKPKGANKTYYHTKDINWLAHEPLLNTFRNIKSHERKVCKARAKQNAALAKRLMSRKPSYRLDHLVKERYPSFVDALRDLDDALTMIHLFATLPAESKYNIPPKAYVVRSGALRRVFVSVKGYYFQVEVLGQSVTWLVPHALSQVLPPDVDYRVMLTFLEFYNTLLQFVNFKLYNMLKLRYPPPLDPRLGEAAAELAAIMKDIAGVRDVAESDRALAPKLLTDDSHQTTNVGANDESVMQARIENLQSRLRTIVGVEEAEKEGVDDDAFEDKRLSDDGDDENELDSSGDEEDEGSEDDEEDGQGTSTLGKPGVAASSGVLSNSTSLLLDNDHDVDDDDHQVAGHPDQDAGTRAAGGALGIDVDPSDEAALCRTLFRGLVIFLGREVPQEPLMLVIRAFGGVAAWEGDGSPHEEMSESITHQVVDRPRQGHRFLSREYVQPQWVLDSANFRVLMPSDVYAPGLVPPPHLSPFVGEADDNGYTPDFAKTIRRLQDAAQVARTRAAGLSLKGADGSEFVGEVATRINRPGDPDGEDLVADERVYISELAKEVRQSTKRSLETEAHENEEISEDTEEQGRDGDAEIDESLQNKHQDSVSAKKKISAEDDELAMADIMMTRKTKKMYNNLKATQAVKQERLQQLEMKKLKLATKGAAVTMVKANTSLGHSTQVKSPETADTNGTVPNDGRPARGTKVAVKQERSVKRARR